MLDGEPSSAVLSLLRACHAAAVVTDFSPLRDISRARELLVQSDCPCPVRLVDAHNVVPVWEASPKREYAARTIRPKINGQLPR